MNNIEELVYSAMQSSLEGYAVAVVDSIEFELKRELTTQEHQQVYVAVDSAITGIAAAQKELHDFKMKLSDAGCLLVEWKQRVEKAEKERDDLLNQEFQQRLENAKYQLHMKDLAIHNIKASRMAQFKKRLAAEAALSSANKKLKADPVLVCRINAGELQRLKSGSYAIVDAPERNPTDMGLFTGTQQKPVVLPEAYAVRAGHPINEGERNVMIPKQGGNWLSRFDVEHAIRAAGGKVEGD